MTSPHALLSGGGSGGHVFPGLAVASELTERGWRVSWAGSERGLESGLVRDREIPFFDLAARPVVGQGATARLRAAAILARSAWRARALVRRLDARVVVGTGGYVSAPAVAGGWLAARPVLLFEPNAEAGLANRLLSRLAAEAAVAFESAAEKLSCAVRTTGIPVRAEFFAVPEELPAAPPLRLLVLGGSHGARQLNEMLPRALKQCSVGGSLAVLHQAGHHNLEATRASYRAANLPADVPVEIRPFLDDVAGAMARSHLVISRAGAITLAEICAAGRPVLLVPLTLAGGHQGTNAHRLRAAGAAEVLPEAAGEEGLAEILAGLLGDRTRLEAMAGAARRLGRSDAASAIADRVERLGAGKDAAGGGR